MIVLYVLGLFMRQGPRCGEKHLKRWKASSSVSLAVMVILSELNMAGKATSAAVRPKAALPKRAAVIAHICFIFKEIDTTFSVPRLGGIYLPLSNYFGGMQAATDKAALNQLHPIGEQRVVYTDFGGRGM